MSKDNELEVKITLDDGSIRRGFLKVSKEGKKTSKTIAKDFSNTTSSMVKNFVGVGAAIGVAFAGFRVLKSAINNLKELETAMAEISTITNTTAESQRELSQEFIQLSTTFGVPAQQQAKAFYQIISAGVTDASKANKLLVAANKLAIGGLTSIGSAIDILTSTVNSYGQSNISAERAADVLFGTVKLGKTTVEELSSSLGQVLPVASALGVSFEDTNAALAALTTRGVSTSEAVTGLNAIFTAVLKKQDVAKQIFGKTSQAFSLQTLRTKGLTEFLIGLNIALDGNTEKLIKLTGRAEAARAIITLAGDDFETLKNNVDDLSESQGAANEAFKKIDETLEQKLNKSSARFNSILLGMGSLLEGTIKTGLDNFNEQFDFYNNLLSDAENKDPGKPIEDLATKIENLKSKITSLTNLSGLDNPNQSFEAFGVNVNNISQSLKDAKLNLAQLQDQQDSQIERMLQQKDIQGEINIASREAIRIAREEAQAKAAKAAADAQALRDAFIALEEVNANGVKSVFDQLLPASDKEIFDARITSTVEQVKKAAKEMQNDFNKIGIAARNGLGRGIGAGFAAFGKALVQGENALEAFGKAFLGSIGQTAIAEGTAMILRGLGYAADPIKAGFAPGMIAKGTALAAFGGVLSGISGGGGASGGSSGTGTIDQAPSDEFNPDIQDQGPTNKIDINIAGDILDSDDTGLRIATLLQNEIDKSGTSILQVT